MKHLKPLCYLLFCLVALISCKDSPQMISLAGEWKFALDPEDAGVKEQWQTTELSDKLFLPGSLQEQGKGLDVGLDTKWTGQIVDSSWYTSPQYEKFRQTGNMKVPFWLNPDKHYVGVAWYQKEVEVPTEWKEKTVILELERTHWQTTLYVDGKEIGWQDALLTPQRYELNGLKEGKHVLTLRVDNRVNIAVGINAHSVSDHTQSNWNGVIGKITLAAKPSLYIDDVQIHPDVKGKKALVKVNLKGKACSDGSTLTLQAMLSGRPIGSAVELKINPKEGNIPAEAILELGEEALLWSEYAPHLYQMQVTAQSADGTDKKVVDFGLREFKANGTRFEVNGQPIFLRGTLECCIFPLTGYPAMENGYWEKIYRTCKEYGLNHVRFHSWCPPEAAFHVADSMGVYLQVECGAWASVGDGEPQDQWIQDESDRILKEYGNHPSFCLLTYGNEPGGAKQLSYLSTLVDYWKGKDNRRAYTTAAGWPYAENADYWNAPNPRIQGWGEELKSIINAQAPSTDYDFRKIIRQDMPTVSHEIGQWCVYPNFKEIAKYTGVLKAKNLEIFQETLKEKGMEDLSEKFLYASGRLQTLCYKADIEAALRTPGFAGFQLLDLHDFPGQGTALVGVLDPFWESKGYVDGKEYSTFCNNTVPLVRFPKMVWLNIDTLRAPIEFAHFGEAPIKAADIVWRVTTTDNQLLTKGSISKDLAIGNNLSVGEVHCPLNALSEPTQLTVTVQINHTSIQNSWNIWVYPASKPQIAQPPYITTRFDHTALSKLNNGEKVLLLTHGQVSPQKGGSVAVGFSSIFWNTAWTRGQAPHTLGIYCDAKHPALASFPNQGYSDYQWWDVVSRCNAMVLDDFPADFRPIVHLIDDWFTNRKLGLLFEAKVSQGKLMVCSADLQNKLDERPAAAQFRQSILEYMSSDRFSPQDEVTPETIQRLLLSGKK
ncbi:MAG: beta-galactosidase [Tannerellaceae bacterium]